MVSRAQTKTTKVRDSRGVGNRHRVGQPREDSLHLSRGTRVEGRGALVSHLDVTPIPEPHSRPGSARTASRMMTGERILRPVNDNVVSQLGNRRSEHGTPVLDRSRGLIRIGDMVLQVWIEDRPKPRRKRTRLRLIRGGRTG